MKPPPSPHPLLRLVLFTLGWLWLGQAVAAQPLLWRIDGEQGPSYLFGTIHSAHPELNRLPTEVEQAFSDADRYYGELELDAATQRAVAARFQLPAGTKLSTLLGPERWQRAAAVVRHIDPQIPLAGLERLRPWAFALSLTLLEDQLTYAGQPMMDQRLYQRARAAGKPTGGLESAAEQAAVFEQLSEEEQMTLLDATLAYMEEAQREDRPINADSYQIYRSGDPNQFVELMGEQFKLPLLLKLKLEWRLLTERNERMAARIDRLLREAPRQRFFFAVGAAHLADPSGVPTLLRQRGYRVQRVRSNEG